MKKVWILLLLMSFVFYLYGCGTTAKETITPSNLTPEQQSIQTLLNSFCIACKNKDTATMATLFTDDSPIKSQYISMFSSPNATNLNYQVLSLTLVSTKVSGNYVYVKSINNQQLINSSLHYGLIYYSDNGCLRISTANNTYKIYDTVNNYELSSANSNVEVQIIRNSDNKLNIKINSDNLNNNSYSIDALTATTIVSNNFYYKDFTNNSFTLKEEGTVLGQYDFSSLTSFNSDTTWITNAVAKGVNYGIVTLSINEGYIFSTKSKTSNPSSWDFQLEQYGDATSHGNTGSYIGWRGTPSGGTLFYNYNFVSANIRDLSNIEFDTNGAQAGMQGEGVRINQLYILYARNNKYYAIQTITDNYPNGPVIFAWVELMNVGTRWYINQ